MNQNQKYPNFKIMESDSPGHWLVFRWRFDI